MDLLAAPLIEEPDLLEEVASIGKDAAEEASKINAMEGQEHAAGGALGPLKEPEEILGSVSRSGVMVEEKIPLETMDHLPSFGTMAGASQPSSSHLALVLAQPRLGAPARQWR